MKWVRRVILISSGFIALLISIIAVGFALNPGATYLLLAMLIQPLIANTRPPPIAEDQLTGAT
jgi:hypothetical protein